VGEGPLFFFFNMFIFDQLTFTAFHIAIASSVYYWFKPVEPYMVQSDKVHAMLSTRLDGCIARLVAPPWPVLLTLQTFFCEKSFELYTYSSLDTYCHRQTSRLSDCSGFGVKSSG
jgi:hypothetical protein